MRLVVRLTAGVGRDIAAHEFADFPLHVRLHLLIVLGDVTRFPKCHVLIPAHTPPVHTINLG
jgi:hypothetical protein